jgi:hypothetical protein
MRAEYARRRAALDAMRAMLKPAVDAVDDSMRAFLARIEAARRARGILPPLPQ